MAKDKGPIEAKDCLSFDNRWNDKLRIFAEESESVNVFNISNSKADNDPLIAFNYKDKKWYAGRYIGNVSFKYNKYIETINIEPRFGEPVLYKMFEEIFNVKFSKGFSSFDSENNSYYLKILISLVWLQKLSNANRHGLPQIKKEVIHNNNIIKGRLLVRPTIKKIHTTGKAVSETKEKVLDKTVTTILHQAHKILKRDYCLGKLSIPDNAMEAIHQIDNKFKQLKNVTLNEFKSIKYHPMYQHYKEIVDFSWQIINSNRGFDYQGKNKNTLGFFLDMAEIWENYIRSIIKKYFSADGWQIINSEYQLYPDRFYNRKIIPDIVLKKGNNYCVFDAKYKRMEYRDGFVDLDRDDFFQIHTYISYLQHQGNVLLGGLIYPVTENKISDELIHPKKLFDCSKNTYFFADGPLVKCGAIYTENFINRLNNIIKV